MRRRWIALLLLFPAYVIVLSWLQVLLVLLFYDVAEALHWAALLFKPSQWDWDEPAFWTVFMPSAAVMAASQLAFLLPAMRPRKFVLSSAKPLKLSMIAAGVVAAALTVATLFVVIGTIELLRSMQSGMVPEEALFSAEVKGWFFWIPLLVSWTFWSVVLWRFGTKRRRYDASSRISGWLLGGTIAEVIVVLPLDLVVRTRSSCHCETGSFIALCFSTWALLWLSGPGIVLAILSRRRKWWSEISCRRCGYAKGPSPGERCPECGTEWMRGTSAKPQAAER